MTADKEMLLYLFSSNIRPLYEQDILDVLANPPGTQYQFRYEEGYVNGLAQGPWADDELGETQVLVHFSLQQEKRYTKPAFIPVRLGEVVSTTKIGKYFVVNFSLADYVSLLEPDKENLAQRVRDYTNHLEQMAIDRPYEFSASLGETVLSGDLLLKESTDPDKPVFELTTQFLQGTRSFRDARFYRFLSLAPSGAKQNQSLDLDGDGVMELTAGRTYELRLLHSQPVDVVERETVTVAVDDAIVRVIGRSEFDIASRYDVVTLNLHAVQADTVEARETMLVVEPKSGGSPAWQGPRLRLRVRVVPPKGKAVATVALASLGLILVGLPSLLELSSLMKIGSIAVGSLLASTLAVLGLRR